jgi:hypothetical protein
MHLDRHKADAQPPSDDKSERRRERRFFAAHFSGIEGVLVSH